MLWVYEQDEGLAVRAQKMTVDGDRVHESDVDVGAGGLIVF